MHDGLYDPHHALLPGSRVLAEPLCICTQLVGPDAVSFFGLHSPYLHLLLEEEFVLQRLAHARFVQVRPRAPIGADDHSISWRTR